MGGGRPRRRRARPRPGGARRGLGHGEPLTTDDAEALRRLQEIPNVGPAIARRLDALGFDGADSLRGQEPEALFARTEAARGAPEDPCLLDTYRAVVAFAEAGDTRPWHAFSRERLAGETRSS